MKDGMALIWYIKNSADYMDINTKGDEKLTQKEIVKE